MTYLQFLIPSFLHRLDNRLMLQLPHIWRTRIHFVAFYAAIAWILLFFIGFLYPLSMFDISRTTYVLDETKRVSSLFFLICGFFALVYWWQQVAKFRIIVAKWYHSCVECVLFALGILLIWQAVNAFKNGLDANIGYRVGRHISAADKAQLYAHNFYLPGGLAYLWGDQFHGVMYRNHYGDPIDSTAFLYFLDAEKLLQKYHSRIKKQGVILDSQFVIKNNLVQRAEKEAWKYGRFSYHDMTRLINLKADKYIKPKYVWGETWDSDKDKYVHRWVEERFYSNDLWELDSVYQLFNAYDKFQIDSVRNRSINEAVDELRKQQNYMLPSLFF